MADWAEEYVTDVGYIHACCYELNSLQMKLALLKAAVSAYEISTACELGFGQGVSLNIHAAASVTRRYGADLKAAHADFARRLAAVSGTALGIFDDSFGEFSPRPDLPDFDYIGLRGVWS